MSAIEKSLHNEFSRSITSRFKKAAYKYKLIDKHDKVAVCVSGGKDSMLMAKLFMELKLYSDIPEKLVFIVMDPGFDSEYRAEIEENSDKLGIPIAFFKTNIFDSVSKSGGGCFLCSRLRRGYLYNKASELGCGKIALGHHYDDIITTNLMSILYGGEIRTMLPKVKSVTYNGMELIRPMYLIRENDINEWCSFNNLKFGKCRCPIRSENAGISKRTEIKSLIEQMKKNNPQVEGNLFSCMKNVRLDAVLGFKNKNKSHSFLDFY